MAETQASQQGQAEVLEEQGSLLDNILAKVDVTAPTEMTHIEDFKEQSAIAERGRGQMIAAALRVFVDAVVELDQPFDRIDKYLIDNLIAGIDDKISHQLDEVLHNEKFQQLESAWRGLKLLIDRTDFRKNVKIEVLNVSKADLQESFEDSLELIQSPLYRHVYTNAYDQPGADPYGAIVTNYEFENTASDMALLQNASKVAASAHCPFISSVGPQFFGKDSMEEWPLARSG
jgi:type VI secretion system protein ImpC